jgi:hypothetical protein
MFLSPGPADGSDVVEAFLADIAGAIVVNVTDERWFDFNERVESNDDGLAEG